MLKILVLILFPLSILAQNQLKGYVTEQNSGKEKVSNVIVRSLGANAATSANDGRFVLTYQDITPGTYVVVQAEKTGWVLVNDKEMSTHIPANPNENPLKIIVSTAAKLEQARKKYYAITDNYITKTYNRKLAAINREKEGWQKEAAILNEQFLNLQKQLNEMADEYSRVNLDDATDIERRAVKFFEEGKIDESIRLRESLHSGQEIKKAVVRKAKEDSIIALHTRNLKKLANDYILQFNYQAAEQKYQELVQADTTNFYNTFELARFLQDLNQHDKAIAYYQKALTLAKDEPYVASTLNNLGNLYRAKNEYPQALGAYEKALEIYERLAKTNPATYEPDMASTLNNLGNLYRAKNEYPQALGAYQKALEIRERLAKTNPATYEPDVAATLNNLGVLYRDKNEYPQALGAYQKALEIRERLAKTNPATYEPDVAATLNNLGNLYRDKNEYPQALGAYQKALEIYERLAKTNPATYEPDVAMTLNNLGVLYSDKNEYPQALGAYQKALEIRERLAKTNPATYEPDVATTLNNLGVLYRDKNEYPQALGAYQKALEIYERLAKTNPATYEPDVASTLNNLGVLYSDKNEYPQALGAYQKALEIYERLAKTNPATYEPYVAATLNNLGNLYSDKNEYPQALGAYQKALEIRERLAKTNPATYEPYVAATLNNLGNLYRAKNEYPQALGAYQKALEIRERLAKTNPATYEPDVATTLNNLGVLYRDKNEYPQALGANQKALEIYERLAKTNPEVYEIDLCRSIVLLGLLQKQNYQPENQTTLANYLKKAKQILPKYSDVPLANTLLKYVKDLEGYSNAIDKLLEIQELKKQIEDSELTSEKVKMQTNVVGKYRELVSNGYSALANDLGANLSSRAWHQMFNKQFNDAELSAREALYPTTFPKTEDYDVKIEWANTNLALALLYQGKYAEAAKIYEALKDKPYQQGTYRDTFLADLEELEKAGITHPDVAKIRELLKK